MVEQTIAPKGLTFSEVYLADFEITMGNWDLRHSQRDQAFLKANAR